MPSDPAVPMPDTGPDDPIATVRSPARRRRFALRRPAEGAVRTLQLLLIGAIVAPLLVLLGGGYLAYDRTFEQASYDLIQDTAVARGKVIQGPATPEIRAP